MKYIQKCRCCGKEFETNSPQKLYCNDVHYLPCPICGKPVLKTDKDFTRPPKCCSTECTHKLRTSKFKIRICVICGEPFIPRSGVQLICDKDHYRECKICGNRFIVDRNTYKTKFACSKECQIELIKQKNIVKYGVEHPMQNPEVQQRHRDAMKSKYGVEFALQQPDMQHKQRTSSYNTCIENIQTCFPYLQSSGDTVSKLTKFIVDALQSKNIPVSLGRQFENSSYDICVEANKTLIEIDPTYAHNSCSTQSGQPKEKYYHSDKTKLAKKYGYRCIHIFDWDDLDSIINLLLPKQCIYARKLDIWAINRKFGDNFLKQNHLQGTCRGQLLYLGLVDPQDHQLYQIMTFGKSRYSKQHDIELLRLCTLSGYRVIGGASKLFKFATQNYGLSNIISYCDLSKFNGDVYTAMGMHKLRQTPPAKVWSKGTLKVTNNLLHQRGFDQLFHTNFGRGASNEELMLKHGWLPVYDCGQAVYEYK